MSSCAGAKTPPWQLIFRLVSGAARSGRAKCADDENGTGNYVARLNIRGAHFGPALESVKLKRPIDLLPALLLLHRTNVIPSLKRGGLASESGRRTGADKAEEISMSLPSGALKAAVKLVGWPIKQIGQPKESGGHDDKRAEQSVWRLHLCRESRDGEQLFLACAAQPVTRLAR